MAAVRVQAAASFRLDEIYRYTRDRWGTKRADDYIIGLFSRRSIRSRLTALFRNLSRPSSESRGYCFRYERHFVYWRILSNGDIGIVTILHERMHQIDRFSEDLEG